MENYLQPMYHNLSSYPHYADHAFSLSSMNRQPDERQSMIGSTYDQRHDDDRGGMMMRTQSTELADSSSTAVVIDDIDNSNNGGECDDRAMVARNSSGSHVMGGNKQLGRKNYNDNSSSRDGHYKKIKKQRYAFQTRSQVDILDDGYRWRKYGQKAVKNNRFPRSYYRCTYQGCNVKKQVQRLSKDEEVVVTTYEGVHSHSIERSTDNFEHILSQMQIYTSC